MKLMYLIGMPGTGKTTVMKEFMKRVYDGPWKQERVIDLLDTHTECYYREDGAAMRVRVLGKYEEGETFSGTDRLSMAVAPKAVEWLTTEKPDYTIVGEGDRLNNAAFFEAAGDDLVLIHLTVSDEERERRYKERGSEQSEKFIQTTKTKCNNIIEKFGPSVTLFGETDGYVTEFVHETPEDTQRIVDFMMLNV